MNEDWFGSKQRKTVRGKKQFRLVRDEDEGREPNTHLHVWLKNPRDGKIAFLTKGSDDTKINRLVDKGWEEVSRS